MERLADLIDIRKVDLSLALTAERQPRFATTLRRQKVKGKTAQDETDVVVGSLPALMSAPPRVTVG